MVNILFILKFRDMTYGCDDYPEEHHVEGYNPKPGEPRRPLSSGLFNSANFVKEMLDSKEGFKAEIVHAIDNNCIDRLVTKHKPDIVIIEAYWVVPEKFEILSKLHPKVTWVIRNHSATPFAATEGIIVDWSLRYMDYPNTVLSCNDYRTHNEFRDLIKIYKPDWNEKELNKRVVYLPNYYPTKFHNRSPLEERNHIDVSCFGAVRPLKNHVMQAISAIQFAEDHNKKLRFHINATRVEGRGEPVMNNLRNLFKNITKHELVEHGWMPHDKFIEVIRTMDIGLQVSFTETFNIVSADMVMNGVPVVTNDIPWVHPLFHADPTNSKSIVKAMGRALWVNKNMHCWQPSVSRLRAFDSISEMIWTDYCVHVVYCNELPTGLFG